MITLWGVALAVLVGAGLSFGQDKAAVEPFKAAEDLLTAKELHPSAALYVSRGEDEVKKASEAADARLKEYRLAAAHERGALQDIIDRKAMATELTKQRDALKQQMDQAVPNLRAQIQALQQQQNAIRMQSGSTGGYGNRYARQQSSMVNTQVNQLNMPISALNAEINQYTMTYNELNNEIKQLSTQPDPKSNPKADDASKTSFQKPASTSTDKKEAYVKALGELRKHVDETNKKYTALADDSEVKGALETLSQRSAKIKYLLGPSKKFHDTVKALEEAEAKVASDTIIEAPRPAVSASAKKKAKMAKKK